MPLSYGAADEPPAIGAARRGDGRRRPRFRSAEGGSLLFLATIGILGAASAGSLLAAGFELLLHPKPAAMAPPAARPAPPPAVTRAMKPSPPAAVYRTAVAAAAAPPPQIAKPPQVRPLAPAARSAMQEGDARLAEGNVAAARFYYEQAADAGDATGALRMGETFDPLFLTIDRPRFVRADPAAARFWYHRALALGAADARDRLADLDREPADKRAAALHRRPEFSRQERVTFREILEQVLHPRAAHATLTPPKDGGP